MFFKPKATIDADDMDWQLECWEWLFNAFEGLEGMRSFPVLFPNSEYFPRSGKSGEAHAEFVFKQVADYLNVSIANFDLVQQEQDIDPVVGVTTVLENVPTSPLGTYSRDVKGKHVVTYSPELTKNLEKLISTFAHEICHPILLTVPEAPPGEPEAEEFATDLAMVFFGFGIFGGNTSFEFNQFTNHDNQGWSYSRSGYLSQNEWGFAIALRSILLKEQIEIILPHCSKGLATNIQKNLKFLRRNSELFERFEQ